MARRVAMTAMPELVAVLHSFVGLAAVLVGYAAWLDAGHHAPTQRLILLIEIWVDVAIGALTFTGSVVAFLKLRGTLSGARCSSPRATRSTRARSRGAWASPSPSSPRRPTDGLPWLLAMTAVAGVLGVHLVAAIGGADMPVVVSMLNSYSGWTASAAGFMLENDLLIITGALVGSERRDPELHHVPRDEPLHLERDLRRLRRRARGRGEARQPAGAPEGEVRRDHARRARRGAPRRPRRW
jgi:NAD(P) transhydrogenase subunit beta